MVTAFIPEFPLFRKGNKNFHYNTVTNNKNLKIPKLSTIRIVTQIMALPWQNLQ